MKYRETWELDSIPDKPFFSEASRRRAQTAGRPKKLTQCPHCKQLLGAREKRQHKCPEKP